MAHTSIFNTDIPSAMGYESKILLSMSGIPILSEVPRFVGGKMQATQISLKKIEQVEHEQQPVDFF